MTCPHIVTSDEGTAYCTLAESAGPAPNEDETLDQMLDRFVTNLTNVTHGRWNEDRVRQAVMEQIISWYNDRQRADS